MKDFYKILNVSEKASLEEMRKARNALAKKTHSDKRPIDDENTRLINEEKMRLMNEAWHILQEPATREDYDRRLKAFRATGVEPNNEIAERLKSGHTLPFSDPYREKHRALAAHYEKKP